MWAAGSRGSGSSELGIPPEISIYSDFGGDNFEPNIRLEEHNSSEGQSSHIPHDVRASTPNTNGQLRDILSDMESNDIDDQVRNILSDVEPIDIECLLDSLVRVQVRVRVRWSPVGFVILSYYSTVQYYVYNTFQPMLIK